MRKMLLLLVVLCAACKTYTVDPESFRQQMKSANMKEVRVNDPMFIGGTITYYANSLKGISVVDKKGNPFYLGNSPSIEMRITQRNGKRRIVYFDTVELRNDTLYGRGSKLLNIAYRKILFDSIVKIELQDGGKNFHYQ